MTPARLLLVLAALGIGRPLLAQSGSIDGTVYDSVRGTALSGAVIVVEGTPNAVRSDLGGKFHLESMPAGTFVLAVESEALDSLGVAVPPATVALREGEHRQLALATPSPETLLTLVCAGADLVEGEGELSGVVRDAATRSAVAGAIVDLSWDVWIVAGVSVEKRHTGQVVRSGADGSYFACGVPAGALVAIRSRAGDRASGLAEVRVSETRIARLDVGLGGPGESSVLGRVTDSTGVPLAGARVGFAGDPVTVSSDEQGAFRISGAPSGSQTLVARRLAFAEARVTVDLARGTNGDAVIRLRPAAQVLAPVTIFARVGSPAADALGFTARQRRGMGNFVDREKIERSGSVPVPELLRGVPGFVVHFGTTGAAALWTRGRQVCTPLYYVDGLLLDEQSTGRSTDVEGLEAYSPGQAPPRYGGASATCAVVLIWTRRAPAETPAERSAPESPATPPGGSGKPH